MRQRGMGINRSPGMRAVSVYRAAAMNTMCVYGCAGVRAMGINGCARVRINRRATVCAVSVNAPTRMRRMSQSRARNIGRPCCYTPGRVCRR